MSLEKISCYCSENSIDVQSVNCELPDGEPLVIFGSRDYQHQPGSVRDRAERVVDELASHGVGEPDFIISGGADGADAVAEAVSILLGVPMVVFAVGGASDSTHRRAEWADQPWAIESVTSYGGPDDDPRSGKGAYLTRNCMMAEVVSQRGGSAFAIYNGSSAGTQHMLDSCQSHGIQTVGVWRYDRADG